MEKTWTTEQEEILSSVEEGGQNLVVEAVAGSGKTSVLLEAAQRSKGKVLIQAYNRSIADELQSRLPKRSFGFGTMNYGPEVAADTAHSMGKQSLEAFLGGKLQVNGYKHADIVRDLVRRELRIYDDDQRKIAESSLKDLVSLCRLTLTNPNDEDAMKALCLHYGIEDPSMVQYVDTVLERGLTVFDQKKIIDFDDMVFLPGFLPSYSDRYRDFEMPKFDKVMTDESQDMNMAQLKCAMLMSKGQTICVGDRYQSIYGFQGADANMFEFIIQRLAARTLDMSICFRCPTSHLKIARKVVPQIKARDGAPVGTINHTETPDFINSEPLRAGDLILCRTNAPIISACVRLLKRGVKARIKGVELAARFNAILRKIAKYPGFSMDNFNYFVWNMWVREEKKRLKELNAGESRLSQVEDFALALISLHQNLSSQVNDVEGLCKALDAMFSLKDTEGVTWLSTVHKAKGLEAERVYILRPELIPLKFKGQQEWETTQEWNLFYVAHTRSKMNLTFVHKPEEV